MTTESATPTAPSVAPVPPTEPVPPHGSLPPPRRLLRSRDRVLGGVAGGIAEYAGLPPLLVRLLFVAAGFMGWGLLLYPALWIVVPDADRR